MNGERHLFQLFHEAVGRDKAAPFAGSPDRIGPALSDAIALSRRTWPSIAVPPELFVPYLAHRLPADATCVDAIGELRVADLWVACACAHGDEAAIALFKQHYLSPIFPLPRDLATYSSEVEQIASVKLLVGDGGRPPKITEYSGRGDLGSWVSVVALRLALGLLRKQKPEVAIDDDAVLLDLAEDDDAEIAHLKRRYRAEFAEAFQHALGELRPRDRNVLRQHYVDQLTMEQIARVYRVHRITVVRWIDRARSTLASKTRSYLVTRMGIGRDEIDSVLRLIRSQLDLSLRAHLGGGTGA